MSGLGGFDGLEIALLREVGSCTVSREVGGAGLSCSRGEFLSEKGKQGGPTGLRAVGRAFGGGVGGEETGEAREVSFEPGFQRQSGGKRGRKRNGEVLELWDEGGPVGHGPIGRRRWRRSRWMREYNLVKNVV